MQKKMQKAIKTVGSLEFLDKMPPQGLKDSTFEKFVRFVAVCRPTDEFGWIKRTNCEARSTAGQRS